MKRKIRAQIDQLKKKICEEQLQLKKEIFDLDYEYFLVSKETLHEKLEKLDALDARKLLLEGKAKRLMEFSVEYAHVVGPVCINCFVENNRLEILENVISQSRLKKQMRCPHCDLHLDFPASISAPSQVAAAEW